MRRFLGASVSLILGVLASLVLSAPEEAFASAASTKGREFWVTFDSNNGGAQDLRLYLSSDSAASVSIAWPDGSSTTHSVSAGSVTTVEADAYADNYVNRSSQGTAANAIRIESDADITVYGAHIEQYTSDAFVAIPTPSLGTEYRVLTHPQDRSHNRGRFSIVAAESGTTTVEITPTVDLPGSKTAGTKYSVTLNQGDVYTSQSISGGGNLDLSGTLIESDKKVVVTGGDNCGNTAAGSCDHIVQYLPPTTSWGRSFILPGSSNASRPDRYRVLANEDGTTVTIDGSLQATIDAGEVFQFDPSGSNAQQTQLVETNNPVLVGQFLAAGNYGGQTGDPAFSLIVPTLQLLSSYNFATPATGFAVNTLTVVAKTADVGSISVPGITLGAFSGVSGTDYSVSRTSISAGSYSISGDSGFGIYVAGFNSANSYNYPGGYAIVDLVQNPGGVEEVESGGSGNPQPAQASDTRSRDKKIEESPQVNAAVPPVALQPRRDVIDEQPLIVRGPILRGGVVPAPPKAPTVLVGGRPTVMSTNVPTTTQLDVRAGTLNLGVKVQEDLGEISEAPDGTTEIAVRKGAAASISGSGFRPGATVQVFMPLQGDNAKELTRIPVQPDGSFDGSAPFATRSNEAPLPIGKNVLQLVSLDNDGNQVVVEMSVNIAQGAPAPEQNRIDGVIPTMTPGQSVATSGGEPVPVRITPVSEQKLAVVEGDGWSMAINVAAEDGGVEPSEGGALLKLVRDESAVISGSGFMPGTRADVWLFSDPTLLGTVTIDENGEFTGEVNIDPNMIPVGEHTLQLQGVGEDGYVKAANLGVLVDDPVEAAPTAVEQGLGFIWWIIAALVVLAVIVVLIASRRRRDV